MKLKSRRIRFVSNVSRFKKLIIFIIVLKQNYFIIIVLNNDKKKTNCEFPLSKYRYLQTVQVI